jgi:cell division protein FtsB
MAYNITKLRSASTIKKVAFFITIIVSLIIINGLVRSIIDLWNKQDVVTTARQELNREKQKNEELKVQLGYVKSEQFVEEEARNKLFLVKPGESDVIIPPSLIEKKEIKKPVVLSPWEQWMKLFLEGGS